ncbi:MAG: helix-turn-helix domain-containing protein [Succinivibrionaceae bacterium]
MNNIKFIRNTSTGLEVIRYENVSISYPEHTHIGHYVFGIVTAGSIEICINHEKIICSEGEIFSVALNIPHAINPISETYSMISICIPQKDNVQRELDIIRNEIIGNPEVEISIPQMSEKVHISQYHMIRKFASENGLTPHKFQIQRRIRKAMELLLNGTKVVDVAYMLGFCDQSHLCRVFKKQVGMSPEDFINSAILSKSDE